LSLLERRHYSLLHSAWI